jgi:hypothetical protein
MTFRGEFDMVEGQSTVDRSVGEVEVSRLEDRMKPGVNEATQDRR